MARQRDQVGEMFELPPGHEAWVEEAPSPGSPSTSWRALIRRPRRRARTGSSLPAVHGHRRLDRAAAADRRHRLEGRGRAAQRGGPAGLDRTGPADQADGRRRLALFDGAARAVSARPPLRRWRSRRPRRSEQDSTPAKSSSWPAASGVWRCTRRVAERGGWRRVGEVLVRDTTHELVAGSNLAFESRGRHVPSRALPASARSSSSPARSPLVATGCRASPARARSPRRAP